MERALRAIKECCRYSGKTFVRLPPKAQNMIVIKLRVIRVPVCEKILKTRPIPFSQSKFTWRMSWESCLTFHMALWLNQVVRDLAKSRTTFAGVPAGFFNKTLGENWKFKFSYRNNAYFFIHHRVFSKHHLVVVYTKFEVKRSILEGCMPIQTENPVFETLTLGYTITEY